MRKFFAFMGTFMIAMVLVACGGDDEDKKKEETAQEANQEVEISEEEKVDQDEVVVEINGTEGKGEKYNAIYPQTKIQMHQFGEDADDVDDVQEHTLDQLIAQQVLLQ